METNRIEIRDFGVFWNDFAWQINCKEPKLEEYIYLPITQIIKMLDIENISTVKFDELIYEHQVVKFSEVVLLTEVDSDGNFVYPRLYEPLDCDSYGFEMIEAEIKE
jgi:hypothetical protein